MLSGVEERSSDGSGTYFELDGAAFLSKLFEPLCWSSPIKPLATFEAHVREFTPEPQLS